MRSRVLTYSVCLWLLAIASASMAADLVTNGGFESTGGWSMSSTGATIDRTVAHNGSACLRVENDGTIDVSAVSDWISFPCRGPRRIIVRGWAKSDGLQPGGQGWKAMRLVVWAQNEKGEGIKLPYSANAGHIGDFGCFAAGTFGWKEFRGNFVLPAGTDSFRFTAGTSFATGRVWFDDISAVEAPLKWQPKEDPEAVFSIDMKHQSAKPVIGIGWNWEFVWGHFEELGADDSFIDQLLEFAKWDEQSFVRFGYMSEFNLKTDPTPWAAPATGVYEKVLAGLQQQGITVLACNWSYGYGSKLTPPYNADEFGASVAQTLRGWLVDDKFSCIKYASLWNEPCWSYSGKYPDDFMGYNKAFDAALRKSGIRDRVKLLATDTTESGYAAEINFSKYDAILGTCADAYGVHDYGAAVEAPRPEAARGYLEPYLQAYGKAAAALKEKPLMMTEFGSGAEDDQGAYLGLLGNCELVLGGLNAGIRAFSRWDYNTPGGYCAFVRKDGVVVPKPAFYYGYAVLTKAIRPGSRVIPTKLARGGMDSGGYKRVHCSVLSGPGDKLTVLIVNDSQTSKKVSLKGLPKRAFYYYYYDSTLPDGLQQAKGIKAGEASITVPPGSVNALVTWRWGPLRPSSPKPAAAK